MNSEILRSLVEADGYENDELIEKNNRVPNFEEAIPIVKEYERIIRTQKESMLNVAYRQGCVFKKFKESDKFMGMVKELGVSKSTIYFKINLIKILDKHTKLNKSSLSLNFFKDYAKTTKEICKESRSQFKKFHF